MGLYDDSYPVELSTVVQYPDLTECTSSYQFGHTEFTEKFLLSKVKTEFAFLTTSPSTHLYAKGHETIKGLNKMGFEPISAMNNWYPEHNGETRKMVLWWKRLRSGPDVVPCEPQTQRYGCRDNYHVPHLQCSGCGFKVSKPPLITGQFWRFHTLLRMPKKLSVIRTRWMETHNFRLFAIGTMADFWTNGWDPKSYSWEKVELPYWKAHGVNTNAREIVKAQVRPARAVKLAG